MVRVEENYQAHLIRKWITKYIDYDSLKRTIKSKESKGKGLGKYEKIIFGDEIQPPWLQDAEIVLSNIFDVKDKVLTERTQSAKAEDKKAVETLTHKTCDPLALVTSEFSSCFSFEVERVNEFFKSVLNEVKSQIEAVRKIANDKGVISSLEKNDSESQGLRKEKKNRELSVIQAYTSLYKKLDELESFVMLNIILCIKILKKHDKLTKTEDCVCMYPILMDDLVYASDFGMSVGPHSQIIETRNKIIGLYAEFCCDNDIIEARGKLMMHKGDDGETRPYYVGMKLGAIFVLLLWFIWDAIVDPGEGQTLWNDPAIYLYSFFGNILIYDWFWAFNVYIWDSSNINYLLLLDLTLQHAPSAVTLASNTANLSGVYIINLILYYKARRGHLYAPVPSPIFPLTLTLIFITYFVTNIITQRDYVSHRLYSPQVIFRIVTSPFSAVSLRETYTADVMTSFIKVFSNGIYAMCYLASESYSDRDASLHQFGQCQHGYMFYITAVSAVLPLWFRFAQCLRRISEVSSTGTSIRFKFLIWPHSYNALKYLLALIVVLMGVLRPVSSDAGGYKYAFIAICMITTAYQFYWDIFMDWGLMQIIPSPKDFSFEGNLFLRKKLLFKRKIYLYYIAMCVDLLLRALWTLSLIPQGSRSGPFSYSISDQLGPFLAMFELFRRTMWGCYRLESEHINASTGAESQDVHPPYHVDRKPSPVDPNKDIKIVAYHVIAGGLALLTFVLLIVNIG